MNARERSIAVIPDEATASRLRTLLRAGYEWDDALKLAMRRTLDLRLATRLLRDGCTPELALRILL